MPFTSNFIGEIFIINKIIIDYNIFISLYIGISIFLCAAYCIWLFNKICYGLPEKKYIINFNDLSIIEISILLPIIFNIILFGIYPNFIIHLLTSNIYYYYSFIV